MVELSLEVGYQGPDRLDNQESIRIRWKSFLG